MQIEPNTSDIFQTLTAPSVDLATDVSSLHRINFYHFCEDETLDKLRDMSKNELEQSRIDLNNHIQTMQPAIVVFVGTSVVAKHFNMKNATTGLFKTQFFQNTHRTVSFLCLPNTRKSNKRNSHTEIER